MSYKENNKYIRSAIENKSYAEEWGRIEKIKKIPSVYRKIKFVEHKEFMVKIMEQNPIFVRTVVESLYLGDIYIIKNALSKKKVNHIIDEINKFTQSSPSKFCKMLAGIPNFHRWIDKDLITAYSIKYTKHSTHFFTSL